MVVGVVVLLLLLVCDGALSSTRDILVVNGKLMVNGQEFLVKGVDYSPTPIGRLGMNGAGYGGTGMCSAKLTPWGEWKSACYDSDYYDGSTDINPQRFPNGMAPIWQRDFPQIKLTGANTIRLYNTNPSTRAATQAYPSLFPYPTGKDHTQFIAMCEQYGLYVIYPLYSDNTAYANLDEATFKRYLRWQIDEVGNSSSILMWQLGNEMAWTWYNNADWNNTAAFTKFNKYADYVRQYTYSKWGRRLPVTNAVINYPLDWTFQFQHFATDIFSINIFGTLTTFAGTAKLCCQYNKPLLMTETGETSASYHKGDFNIIWYNVIRNIPNGLIGAIYFEETDEVPLNKYWGLFGTQTAVLPNGQNSTQTDVFIADAITPKQLFYDIVNGTYGSNNQSYNMNANMFTLLGRQPYNLTNVPDYCLAINSSYKICPGGSPTCSGNGACDRGTGTCTCGVGWSGTACQIPVCPSSSAGVCSGKGRCSTFVSPPECYCNPGFYGPYCNQTVGNVTAAATNVTTQKTCPGGCSNGNGACNTTTGTCACVAGWTGLDCAVTYVNLGDINIAQYFQGCYALLNGWQKIVNAVQALIAPVTNQNCRTYCSATASTYAASVGGSQCYCTNSTLSGQALAAVASAASCTLACSGDSTQFCGGTNATSFYVSSP